jgi:hypothetical protein
VRLRDKSQFFIFCWALLEDVGTGFAPRNNVSVYFEIDLETSLTSANTLGKISGGSSHVPDHDVPTSRSEPAVPEKEKVVWSYAKPED